jgi:type II secretory pathway pseudopilin PulG
MSPPVQYQKQRSTEHGVTLVEIIAVVAIMAAIIVGIAGLYISATRTQAQTQVLTDLIGTRKVVQNYLLANGTYGTTDLTTYFATSGNLPPQLVWQGSQLLSVNNIRINIIGNDSNVPRTVRFQLRNVTRDVCIHLLTTPLNWLSVRIGSGSALSPTVRTPAQAASDCPVNNSEINFVSE